MDISYKWLKRYIDFNLSPRRLAEALTSLGLECDTVEEVETIKGGLRGLVIGKVLTCIEHPNSDHLHITTCDLGTGEPVQIVCGAPNVAAGQTVVVATVGTKLYDGDKEFQIKKSKIRGVESFGMICAEDEIGIGTAHDGIIVIDKEIAPGTPAAEYYNIESDYRLEVELTPNRVDAASHYGVARDLRAWLARQAYENGKNDAIPEIYLPDISAFTIDRNDSNATVRIEDHEGCPRYSGVTVRGVKVGPSPEWLSNLLIAAGQRPINNIVDITNFILLGMGQPLHCFDLNKVKDETIVVRTCKAGTKFVTLDGVEHELHEADMMICDSEKPLCIAGVFGGLDSGVTEDTKDVFIESAYFNPTRVRKTARRHGLSTDASFRYERGTDPCITVYAAKLAAVLIKELCGGEICGDVQDINPNPATMFPIMLEKSYCDSIIGKSIPSDLIRIILTALEIQIAGDSDDKTLKLSVPCYRVDVQRPCDVVEEILRVYGYNNVEFGTEMHANLSSKSATDESFTLQNLISEQLTANGFSEIMNNSLSSIKYYTDNSLQPAVCGVGLMNPLSTDLCMMRQTLLFGGLESITHNLNRKSGSLRFYEFGNVYRRDPEKESTAESPLAPFSEEMNLAIWMTADKPRTVWNTKAEPATFFDLKGIVFNIFRRLGIACDQMLTKKDSNEYFSNCLCIQTRSGKKLGTIGIVGNKLMKMFDLECCVLYAELYWPQIFKLATKTKTLFSPIPRTQPVRRDLALLIDRSVTFAQIEETVKGAEKKLLRDVVLFDVYEGKNLPSGKKSYAISMTLQDDEKTLQDKQIDAIMKKITEALRSKLGAELR